MSGSEPGPSTEIRHPGRSRSRTSSRLQGLIVAILIAAVVCQLVQQTDPMFPFLYFTIDSAVLEVVVMTCRLVGRAPDSLWFARARGAAAVGVILSALMFAAVIAPNSPSGGWFNAHDDLWVRTATVLFHGVAPFPVAAEFLVGSYPTRPPLKEATTFTWWPLGYLVTIAGLSSVGLATMPYVFLQPSHNGAGPTSAAVMGLWVIVIMLGSALLAGHRLVHRKTPAASTQ